MKKSEARALLGGSDVSAAEAIGVTRSAFAQWPEELPARLADRVQAAVARQHGDIDRLMKKALASQRPAGAH
jgi:hypothetical protein